MAALSWKTEKVKIIHEFKLSDKLSEFVTGDSVEDMRKRAETLSKHLPGDRIPIDKDGKPVEKASDSKE